MNVKRSLLLGAAVATISASTLGGANLVSAATDTSSNSSSQTSLVDKLAAKFKLSKTDVQAVFDEDRAAREAEHEADQKQKLVDAVTSGKLTQAQADHITSALAEIKTLRGTTDPKDLSDNMKSQIKTKLDALRDWAKTNNIDMQYVMMGHGGPGGFGGARGDKESSSTN